MATSRRVVRTCVRTQGDIGEWRQDTIRKSWARDIVERIGSDCAHIKGLLEDSAIEKGIRADNRTTTRIKEIVDVFFLLSHVGVVN
jgi:hypothetical protein